MNIGVSDIYKYRGKTVFNLVFFAYTVAFFNSIKGKVLSKLWFAIEIGGF